MSIFEFAPEVSGCASNNQQDGGKWGNLYERHAHQGGRGEYLPPVIDLGAGDGGIYNSSYYNCPAYSGGMRNFNPIVNYGGYGENRLMGQLGFMAATIANAADYVIGNSLTYKGYGDNSSIAGGSGINSFGYGDNSLAYKGDNSFAYDNYKYAGDSNRALTENAAGRYGDNSKQSDKYANVPIEKLPDDGTATAELNRRELARVLNEDRLARNQSYQAGLSQNRWLHSSYRQCYGDNNQLAEQQAGRANWWQRNWQG